MTWHSTLSGGDDEERWSCKLRSQKFELEFMRPKNVPGSEKEITRGHLNVSLKMLLFV
jgi:hypothetical protein